MNDLIAQLGTDHHLSNLSPKAIDLARQVWEIPACQESILDHLLSNHPLHVQVLVLSRECFKVAIRSLYRDLEYGDYQSITKVCTCPVSVRQS